MHVILCIYKANIVAHLILLRCSIQYQQKLFKLL